MPSLRILLDNNVPIHLIPLLRPHEAAHAARIGLSALSNGELIRAARAAGFQAILTCDQNIEFQQNPEGQEMAFIVLSTTHWQTFRANAEVIVEALATVQPGSFTTVALPRPPLRRRPFPPAPGEQS